MMTHLSSTVTFFLSYHPRRARGTPRHSTSDVATPAGSVAGLDRCFNPAFFRPSHCRHRGCGSVRGGKMRHPHTTDDIQAEIRGSNTLLPGGFLEGWESPQRPSIRASRDTGQSTLYCMRPQAIRGSLEGAHPSDPRSPKEHQVRLRRLDQVNASQAHHSSRISLSSLWPR